MERIGIIYPHSRAARLIIIYVQNAFLGLVYYKKIDFFLQVSKIIGFDFGPNVSKINVIHF